jgi:hypothetical protein
MEPEGLLLSSEEAATGLCPQLGKPNSHPKLYSAKIEFSIVVPSTLRPRSSELSLPFSLSHQNLCTYF